jgi:hypothetical protein
MSWSITAYVEYLSGAINVVCALGMVCIRMQKQALGFALHSV